MKPHVLILSSLYDFSADLVALRLQHAGTPYVRLNREQFSDHRLTLDPLVPELIIHGPSGSYHIDRQLGLCMVSPTRLPTEHSFGSAFAAGTA